MDVVRLLGDDRGSVDLVLGKQRLTGVQRVEDARLLRGQVHRPGAVGSWRAPGATPAGQGRFADDTVARRRIVVTSIGSSMCGRTGAGAVR